MPIRSLIHKIFYLILSIILFGFLYWILTNSSEDGFVDEGKRFIKFDFKKQGELLFLDSVNNLKAKINIEVANDDDETAQGLMYRYNMDETNGMLFIFPKEEFLTFWMKNTYITLDIIFVNSEKEIVNIHEYTEILSKKSYQSSLPVKYVIEVNGGFCSRNNITINNKINFMPSTFK
jgi:uncharacterized protein